MCIARMLVRALLAAQQSAQRERAIDIISLSALLADSYYGEAAKKWRATHLAEWARGVASSAVMTGQVAFLFGT